MVTPPFHKYVYGDVPPVTVTLIEPFEPPKHVTGVAIADAVGEPS